MVNIWGSHLEVKDGYPNDLENIDLPVITVNYVTSQNVPRELGTDAGDDINYWHVMIFARGKGERDDMAYDVYQLLRSGCDVYDFSTGSPVGRIGYMDFTNITAKPVYPAGENVPRGERNRSVVVAKAEVSITGA